MWYNEIIKAIIYSGLVLLIINIFNINPNFNLNKENEVLNHKIDSLQSNIDSFNVKIMKLDSLNSIYKKEIKQNQIKLSELKLKSDLNKKKQNEENNRINNLSNSALISEFTNAFQ